ncbi:RNA 2'-phosphotransferase [Tautonia plasticadhaerens]|uniref:Probable RNA 2'-phosphotransferase n=1 Tax=Tautonia plasticadhaerens TaxID=2527974 RepID=A0A518HBH2_9BACT|nr:RNA 2'-phosphotransferase [Tautonia plasticadhaerens]QDV38199.1 RNA 2'-phosphotransferase [Tautonia plasticadhaerens]
MSQPKSIVRVSKFLSLVLRHRPESIGLTLDEGGWASVEDLIARAGRHGTRLSRELIAEVVASNDTQRFRLSEYGSRIRASQGHSISVELGLEPVEPPGVLDHGTATRFLDSILRDGLRPSGRQHVHLSGDVPTAEAVGRRHGRPVVLEVASGRMVEDGFPFFRSDNGVWLTARVPPGYLEARPGRG